jgi:hypothetical protein
MTTARQRLISLQREEDDRFAQVATESGFQPARRGRGTSL